MLEHVLEIGEAVEEHEPRKARIRGCGLHREGHAEACSDEKDP